MVEEVLVSVALANVLLVWVLVVVAGGLGG